MKILNFGSLNLDYVYAVDHIVQPGETISSLSMEIFPGGKGLNQSVALAKAGAEVYHAGMIGRDGDLLLRTCKENGVHTEYIKTLQVPSGNAIIQVAENGENSIVLFGGANQANTKEHVDRVLSQFEKGDMLLLQNEINLNDYLIDEADKKGMLIALNPSPYNSALESCDLSKVGLFLINEVEGGQITGKEEPEEILAAMEALYPKAGIVLTLGSRGVMFAKEGNVTENGIYKVKAVDTTAAGDTFTGYFLHLYMDNKCTIKEMLMTASKASALAVSRKGASPSIPLMEEVMAAGLKEAD